MPDTQAELGDAVAAPTDFVYRAGQQFMVNNQRFRHVGINIPHLLYETAAQWDQELAGAQSAKVSNIRLFLPNNQYSKEEIGDRLRALLDRSWPKRIRLTVAMTHAYLVQVGTREHRCGHAVVRGDYPSPPLPTPDGRCEPRLDAGGFYTRAVPFGQHTIWMLNDPWLDWGHKSNYLPLALYIADRFKTEPGIFAWDISNEVNIANQTDLLELELAYYSNVAAALKRADPNHLVTTGAISTHWLGLYDSRDPVRNDNLKNRLYRDDPNIDYVVVHEYDDDVDDERHHTKDDIARADHASYFNKPVVIEEFGAVLDRTTLNPPRSPYGPDGVIGHVRRYYQRHFFGDPAFRVDAVLQWGVTFHDSDTGNNDGTYGPKAQGKLDEYVGVWRDYSQRLASDNDYSNAIVVDNYYVHNDGTRAEVRASDNWTGSTYVKQFWGTGYRVNYSRVGDESDPFVFLFFIGGTVPQTKTVDAWWTEGPNRSTQAPFRMEDKDGNQLGARGSMNQQTNGGRWNELGTRSFPPGWNRVVFSIAAPTSGAAIIADAVRIR